MAAPLFLCCFSFISMQSRVSQRGQGAGWDPSPSRSWHWTVRQGPAKDRGLGTTAAEQSTLLSTDQTRNTEASICGKDCDLLPSHT